MVDFEALHFLRPEWFWAVLPLLFLVALLARNKAKGGNWQSVVDPALLPHLLVGENLRQRRWPLAMITLAGLLAITALAGPVWQKLEQPVFSQPSSLVILLDLSRSMDATDTKPSRLARAKLKLKDILQRRREGETALIAYAADAFVVTPLSSDSQTIASQLSGLTTDLMPAQGSRPDLALSKGRELLHQASRISGSLLLVSDGIEGAPPSALNEIIGQLRGEGYQLHLLGVGSTEGAPIPLPGGGFMKDRDGNIVLAALDAAQMRRAAQQGGGIYQPLSADERDIDALLARVEQQGATEKGEAVEDMVSDQWQEEGVWLLLPLLVIALFAFRRGVLLLALVMVLPLPRESMAAGMDTLWRTRDQQAQQAFDQGDSKGAAELFENKEWRAAAQYRAGNYQQALEQLKGLEGAEAVYNRGNALSQLGQLEPALQAYEEALKLDPTLEDAAFNRDKVKQWLKESQQQNEGKPGESGEPSNDPSESQDEQQGQQDSSESEQSGEQQGESSPSESEGEQQQGEESASSQPSDDQPSGSEGEEARKSQSAEEQAAEDEAAQQLAEQLAKDEKEGGEQPEAQAMMSAEQEPQLSPEEREQLQATEQWLRRIPDDPSGLWRRKFEYQYKRQRELRGEEDKPW